MDSLVEQKSVTDSGRHAAQNRCRTCLEDIDIEKEIDNLLSPCNCRGSQALVHVECFKKWAHNKCSVCGFNFFANQPSFQPEQVQERIFVANIHLGHNSDSDSDSEYEYESDSENEDEELFNSEQNTERIRTYFERLMDDSVDFPEVERHLMTNRMATGRDHYTPIQLADGLSRLRQSIIDSSILNRLTTTHLSNGYETFGPEFASSFEEALFVLFDQLERQHIFLHVLEEITDSSIENGTENGTVADGTENRPENGNRHQHVELNFQNFGQLMEHYREFLPEQIRGVRIQETVANLAQGDISSYAKGLWILHHDMTAQANFMAYGGIIVLSCVTFVILTATLLPLKLYHRVKQLVS